MHSSNRRGTVVVVAGCILATTLAGSVAAQMCKWVDENGSVHYAERCPEGVEGERVELQPGPSPEQEEAAARRLGQSRQAVASREAERLREREAEDIEWTPREDRQYLSPADVDCPTANRVAYVRRMEALCEQAREAHIAPLRQAEIEKCVHENGRDRAGCEDYYADFLNPQTLWYMRASRMFDHLPECVIARTCREQAGLPEN